MKRKPIISDRLRTYLLGVAIGLMLVGLLMMMRMNQGRAAPNTPSPPPASSP